MLVKDESDIIETTVRHLLAQVDHVIVSDNLSTDGTRAILDRIRAETVMAGGQPQLEIVDDREVGYRQSEKTTNMARHAYQRGFSWVIPCDADEVWYAPDGRRLSHYLEGLAPDVMIVQAQLYNHLPTSDDPAGIGGSLAGELDSSPFKTIGWRQREHGALPKVCARCRPDLRIGMGNHDAHTDGTGLTVPGLVIRHFSWRTPEQYLRKIRNGCAAYAVSGLPETYGAHWRMFEHATDEAIIEHFHTWFHSADPHADATLIYDPTPLDRWAPPA